MIPELLLRKALSPEQRSELDLALESPNAVIYVLDSPQLRGLPNARDIIMHVISWTGAPQGSDYWGAVHRSLPL